MCTVSNNLISELHMCSHTLKMKPGFILLFTGITENKEKKQGLKSFYFSPADHPVKLELLDEEVIELGPTANSDNLEVQSRLVKNANQSKQQSRQVIEVKENQPPPCHINPSVEDPDAIVVK